MIKFLRRAVAWWWREVKAPFQSDPPRQPLPWDDPEHDVKKDVRDHIKSPAFREPPPIVLHPDLLEELQKLEDKVVEYPPVREQSTQDWVTERLQQLTGGLTRHPMDITNYPTPPTEADKAAREHFNRPTSVPIVRGYFTHGYSMRYLHELLRRADKRDMTLSAEDLMSLRSRGLA
jgi:hypothetical protein